MKLLEDRILKDGEIIKKNVLRVDSFLNHQVDTVLLNEMGKELRRLFEGVEITKVITIESGGIPLGYATANALNVPLIYAKKTHSSNMGADNYVSVVHSFTKNIDYDIIVSRKYINKDDKILIVDDFLANGCAILGLAKLIKQAHAEVVGAGIAIEKGFQNGGKNLRESGVLVHSLAIIDSMDNNEIKFKEQ